MSIFTQPTPSQLNAFREADPVAIDEVVTLVLPQIYRWALAKYDNLPEQETLSVVNQVFAEICNKSDRYDPKQALFTTYVINLLKKRLADLFEKERKIIETEITDLDLAENQLNSPYKELEEEITIDDLFETVLTELDEIEREFLKLMRDGEKSLEVYVAVLGNFRKADKPEREANTIKERIRRKLRSVAHNYGI